MYEILKEIYEILKDIYEIHKGIYAIHKEGKVLVLVKKTLAYVGWAYKPPVRGLGGVS